MSFWTYMTDSSVAYKRKYFEKCLFFLFCFFIQWMSTGCTIVLDPIDFLCRQKQLKHSSQSHLFSGEKRKVIQINSRVNYPFNIVERLLECLLKQWHEFWWMVHEWVHCPTARHSIWSMMVGTVRIWSECKVDSDMINPQRMSCLLSGPSGLAERVRPQRWKKKTKTNPYWPQAPLQSIFCSAGFKWSYYDSLKCPQACGSRPITI